MCVCVCVCVCHTLPCEQCVQTVYVNTALVCRYVLACVRACVSLFEENVSL